jgi:hypothetical protein
MLTAFIVVSMMDRMDLRTPWFLPRRVCLEWSYVISGWLLRTSISPEPSTTKSAPLSGSAEDLRSAPGSARGNFFLPSPGTAEPGQGTALRSWSDATLSPRTGIAELYSARGNWLFTSSDFPGAIPGIAWDGVPSPTVRWLFTHSRPTPVRTTVPMLMISAMNRTTGSDHRIFPSNRNLRPRQTIHQRSGTRTAKPDAPMTAHPRHPDPPIPDLPSHFLPLRLSNHHSQPPDTLHHEYHLLCPPSTCPSPIS